MSKLSLGVQKAVLVAPDAVLVQPPNIVIPETPAEMVSSMNALGGGVMLAGWATAATVYAWTEDRGRGRPKNADKSAIRMPLATFADLGIRGLTDSATVARYRSAWQRAVDAGWAKPVAPGAVVTLPSQDFSVAWQPSSGLMSSDSPEWYTPPHVIAAVVATLGAIDLDPCADPGRTVPAGAHFTEEDDGLAQAWHGRVYMNPPYGPAIPAWVDHLVAEHHAGRVEASVSLIPARTETDWWAAFGTQTVCFIHGRLSFSGQGAAPFPSAVIYLGPDDASFVESFAPLGEVYRRVS